MAKTAKNLGKVINDIYDLLTSLDDGERTKVLNSVHQLFEVTAPPAHSGTGTNQNPPSEAKTFRQNGDQSTPQKFYAQKNPATNGGTSLNKGEMLAVAARHREQNSQGDHHASEDFAAFFGEARVNFDKKNFPRDMKNAQRQAGLFNTGGERGRYQLSYYGQQYVDTLPDREAIKKLSRPNRKSPKKKKVTK